MNTRRFDVTCIGELIVDLIATEPSTIADAKLFRKSAGGASANVAVGVARLGGSSAFVGKVGNDSFGRFLRRELKAASVDTGGLVLDSRHRTRLAFVSLTKSGDRDFEFWERQPADEQLGARDVSMTQLAASRIIHISSFLLLNEPSRSTALNIAAAMHRRGVFISFDPNIRLSLWDSVEEMRSEMRRMLKYTSILRLNETEAFQLTGTRTIGPAAKKLLAMGPSLVAITRGEKGCLMCTDTITVELPPFQVEATDTTGCGDAFLAGLLYGVVEAGTQRQVVELEKLTSEELSDIGRFANAAGAITATRSGVIPSLPKRSEVKKFLKEH